MADDLPKEFDVIVLGSGMPESIVAAAFSRIGQTVLHLDRNEYYSGDWASFNLQGIEMWAKGHQTSDDNSNTLQRPNVDEKSLLEEDGALIQLPLDNSNFSQIDMKFHVEEGEDEVKVQEKNVISQTDTETVQSIVENCLKDESGQTEIEPGADSGGESSLITKTLKKDNLEQEQSTKINNESNGMSPSNTEISENPVTEENKDIDNKAVDEESKDIDNKEVNNHTDDEDKEKNANTDLDVASKDNALCDENKSDEGMDMANQIVESGRNTAPTEESISKESHSVEFHCKKWTVKRLRGEWRKFNLDLSPKVLFSGGDMVELLISSDIAKYCEFKTVTRILTFRNGDLEKVPCSRADVFGSKTVSMIEKRMLMKFLQFVLGYEEKIDEVKHFLEKPFMEFLAHKKLTANIKHYIQHSIAMATDSTTTEQGLKQMQKFLKSVGRYGNTAFLWSLYGSGELPQSFCRMCAVFGGLYCLRMSASSLIVNKENRCTGITTTEGQKINCKWLIVNNNYAPADFISTDSARLLSRAIIIADQPLLSTGQQELSMMCLPCTDDGDRPIIVLELPPSTQACPKDTYVFHLTRKGSSNGKPQDDLSFAIETLFAKEDSESSTDKPTILWSMYFTQRDMSTFSVTDHVPVNVILMSGPGPEVDIDRPVCEAREVFQKILPDEEFLPKAPNPEDIIYVDDAEAPVTEDSSQSEFKDTDDSQQDTVSSTNRNESLAKEKESSANEQESSANEKEISDKDKDSSSSSSDRGRSSIEKEVELSLDKQNRDEEVADETKTTNSTPDLLTDVSQN